MTTPNGWSRRLKLLSDFIAQVGFPCVLVLILLGIGCWQLDTTARLQRETLRVVESNTAAIDSLRDEIRELRRE